MGVLLYYNSVLFYQSLPVFTYIYLYLPHISTYFKRIYTYFYIFSCIFLLISTYLPHKCGILPQFSTKVWYYCTTIVCCFTKVSAHARGPIIPHHMCTIYTIGRIWTCMVGGVTYLHKRWDIFINMYQETWYISYMYQMYQ